MILLILNLMSTNDKSTKLPINYMNHINMYQICQTDHPRFALKKKNENVVLHISLLSFKKKRKKRNHTDYLAKKEKNWHPMQIFC